MAEHIRYIVKPDKALGKVNAFFIFIPFLAVIFLILFQISSAGAQEFTKTLNLKDAIRTALLNNKSIQIQDREIQYAKANITDAYGAFLPKVDAGFGYTYNSAILEIPSSSSSKKDPLIFSGYQNNNLISASLNESVYNGGANISLLKQARLNLEVQQETLRAARLEVEFETKRLFYGLLLAYETKRISEDLVNQAKAHYEEVKSQFGQGTASKFDVLQSSVQVSRLIPQLVEADNAIYLIMAEFKRLLSIDMKDDIKIEGALDYSPIDLKEEEFLNVAYRNKPEMILKLLGIDIDKWGIEFAKAGWRPQVSFTANYTGTSNNLVTILNSRHDVWNVGIKASINIFDGFSTKAKVDEAKVRFAQANLQKEDIVEEIAVSVKNACLNLTKSQSIIDAERDSIAEAKEALRLSDVRYKNGVGINLDIFDAEVALAEVEQNLAQGKYDYIMAKADLDRIMGREFYNADYRSTLVKFKNDVGVLEVKYEGRD